MSSTRWITETVEGSHEFNIEGYSLAKGSQGVGKSMTSGKFSVCGHDWVIVVYLDGIIETCKDYISVYVNLVSPTEVRALHEFILLDKSGKGEHGAHYTAKSPRTFNTTEYSWGYKEYMKRSELETSSYLKDDCVTIRCTIGVVQTRVEEGKHSVIPIPPSNMSQNFKGLLESEFGTDIKIQVGNESFKAHKSILAARSPVFKAMFFGAVGNPNMDTVSIKEVDPFVFRAMLLFLYSDEFPETRELSSSDSSCTSTSILHHLLAAADRYDLARLKLMCEEKLCEEISADTVATTLALADQHQCLQLRTVCLNFAAKPKNLGEIMKSEGYAYLEKSCPSVLTDLLKINAAINNEQPSAEMTFLGELITFPASRGFPDFIKRSELETSSYLRDDCLSIHCIVGVVQTRVEEEKHYVFPGTSLDMSENLKDLLETKIGSDVTIQVGNEFFRSHKLILAARSPVFRAMFFGPLGNPDMETVVIEEVDPHVFQAMLIFLYSDELPETNELSDSDSPCTCTSTSFLHHLLAAAYRYDLARLKFMCEENFCEEITAKTVATTLALADQHQCLQLKTVCLNIAAKPENLGEVMNSDWYANLENSCPSLITDLLRLVQR